MKFYEGGMKTHEIVSKMNLVRMILETIIKDKERKLSEMRKSPPKNMVMIHN